MDWCYNEDEYGQYQTVHPTISTGRKGEGEMKKKAWGLLAAFLVLALLILLMSMLFTPSI
jgi:hypothetical protein